MESLKILNCKLLEKLNELKQNKTIAENKAKTALLYAMYLWNRAFFKRLAKDESEVLDELSKETVNEIVNSFVGTAYYYLYRNVVEVFKYILSYENYAVIDAACESVHELLKGMDYPRKQGKAAESETEIPAVTEEEMSDSEQAAVKVPKANETMVISVRNVWQFLSGYDTREAWEEFAELCGSSKPSQQIKRPLYWSMRLLGWIKFYDTHYEEGLKDFIGTHVFSDIKSKKYTLNNRIIFPDNFLENNLILMQRGLSTCMVDYNFFSRGNSRSTRLDFAGVYRTGVEDYVRANRCFKDASDDVIREYLKVCINDGDRAKRIYECIFDQVSNVLVWFRLLDEETWTEEGRNKLLTALKSKISYDGVLGDARILTDNCLQLVDVLEDESLVELLLKRFLRKDGRYWKQADPMYRYDADAFYWIDVQKNSDYQAFLEQFYKLVCKLRVGDKEQRNGAAVEMEALLGGNDVYYKSAARMILEKDSLMLTDFDAMLKNALEKDDVALLLCCIVFVNHIRQYKSEDDGRNMISDAMRTVLAAEISKRSAEEVTVESGLERVLCSYILLKNSSMFMTVVVCEDKLGELEEAIGKIKFTERNARYRYYDNRVWEDSLANLFERIMLIESFEDVNRYGMLLTKLMRIDFGFERNIEEFNRTDVVYSNKDAIYEAFLRNFSDPDGWDILTKYYHEGDNNTMRDTSNLVEVIKYPKDHNVIKFAYTNVKRSLERTEYSQDAPNLLLNNVYLFGVLEDEAYFDEFLNQIRRSSKFKHTDSRTIQGYVELFCGLPLKSEKNAETLAEKYICDLMFELMEQTAHRRDLNVGTMINESFKHGCRLERVFLAENVVEGVSVYANSSKLMNFIARFGDLDGNADLQEFFHEYVKTDKLFEKDKTAYDWWKKSKRPDSEVSEEDTSFHRVSQIVFSEYPACKEEKICGAMELYYARRESRTGKYWDLLKALTDVFAENIELQKKVYLYVTEAIAFGSEADNIALEILERALRNIVHSVNGGNNTWDSVRTRKSWYAARYLCCVSENDGDASVFFEQVKNENTDKFESYLSALSALAESEAGDEWKKDVVFCGITNYWDGFINKLLMSSDYIRDDGLRGAELKKYLEVVENESFWRRALQVLCYASVSLCYDKYASYKEDFPHTHTMVEEYFQDETAGTAETHLKRIWSVCKLNAFTANIYERINPFNQGQEESEEVRKGRIACLQQLDFVLRHSSAARYMRNFSELVKDREIEEIDIEMLSLAVLCLFRESDYLEFVDALWGSKEKIKDIKKAKMLLKYLENDRFMEGLGNYVYEYCKRSDGFEDSKDAFLKKIIKMQVFKSDKLKKNWTRQKKDILKVVIELAEAEGLATNEIFVQANDLAEKDAESFSHEAFGQIMVAVMEDYPEIYNNKAVDRAMLYVTKIQAFVKEYYEKIAHAIVREQSELSIKNGDEDFIPPVYRNHAKELNELVQKYNAGETALAEIKSLRLQEDSYYSGINLSFVMAHSPEEDENIADLKRTYKSRTKTPEKRCKIAEKIYYSLLYSDAFKSSDSKKDLYWRNCFFRDWAFDKINALAPEETEKKLGILYELIAQTNYLFGVKKVEYPEMQNKITDPFGFLANVNRWKNNNIIIQYFKEVTEKFFDILESCRLSYEEGETFRIVFGDTKQSDMRAIKECYTGIRSIYECVLKDILEAEEKVIGEVRLAYVENALNGTVAGDGNHEALKGFGFAEKYEAVRERYNRYTAGGDCPVKVYILNEKDDTTNRIFFGMYNDGIDLTDVVLDFYENGSDSRYTSSSKYTIAAGTFAFGDCDAGDGGTDAIRMVCVKAAGKQYDIKPEYKTTLIEQQDKAACIDELQISLYSRRNVVLVNNSSSLADEIYKELKDETFGGHFKNAWGLDADAAVLRIKGMSETERNKVRGSVKNELHTLVLWEDFSFIEHKEVKEFWNSVPKDSKVSFVFVLSEKELENKPDGFYDDNHDEIVGKRLFRDCLGIDNWFVPPCERKMTESALHCLEMYSKGEREAKDWMKQIGTYLLKEKIERVYVYPSDIFRAVDGLKEETKNELMLVKRNDLMKAGDAQGLLTGGTFGTGAPVIVGAGGVVQIAAPGGVVNSGTGTAIVGQAVNVAETINQNEAETINIADTINQDVKVTLISDEFVRDLTGATSEQEFDEALEKMESSLGQKIADMVADLTRQMDELRAKSGETNDADEKRQLEAEIEKLKAEIKDLQENPQERYCRDYMTALSHVDTSEMVPKKEDKKMLLGYNTDAELEEMEAALVASDVGVNLVSEYEEALVTYALFKKFNRVNNSLAGFGFGLLADCLLQAFHEEIYNNRLGNDWWKSTGMGQYKYHLKTASLDLTRYSVAQKQQMNAALTLMPESNRANRMELLAFNRGQCSAGNAATRSSCKGCNNKFNCASYQKWMDHKKCLDDDRNQNLDGLVELRNKSGHPGALTVTLLERLKTLMFKDGGIVRIRELYDMYKSASVSAQQAQPAAAAINQTTSQNQAQVQSQASGTARANANPAAGTMGTVLNTYKNNGTKVLFWCTGADRSNREIGALRVLEGEPQARVTGSLLTGPVNRYKHYTANIQNVNGDKADIELEAVASECIFKCTGRRQDGAKWFGSVSWNGMELHLAAATYARDDLAGVMQEQNPVNKLYKAELIGEDFDRTNQKATIKVRLLSQM